MKYNPSSSRKSAASVLGTSLLAVLCLVFMTACAQTEGESASAADAKGPCIGCSVDGKTTPMTADGHPNLSGFWNTPPRADNQRQLERSADGSLLFEFSADFDEVTEACIDDSCQVKNQPPYKPEFMPKVKEIADTMYLGTTPLDPIMNCRPQGVPRTGIGGMQAVHTPELIALLYEGAPSSIYRVIYLDGRPVPEDLETSYMGYSTGKWEGNTLVVKTIGLNEDTWLGGSAHGTAKYTSIHSDKLEVTERWTREGNTLTVETTVVDPVMFTEPWVLNPRKVQMSNPGDYIRESICTPDNSTRDNIVDPKGADKGQLFHGASSNAVK